MDCTEVEIPKEKRYEIISTSNVSNFRQKLSWVDKYDLGNRAFNDAMTLDQVSNSKFEICRTIAIASTYACFTLTVFF